MKRIALSAGHYPAAPGARYNGIIEHYYCMDVLDICFNMYERDADLYQHYELFRVPTGTLREKVKVVNDASCDAAIELHLNAVSDPSAGGTLTLYSGTEGSLRLAEAIHGKLLQLGLRNRGIVIGYYRLDPKRPLDYFLRKTVCPAVILEPAFCSNPAEAEMLKENTLSLIHI